MFLVLSLFIAFNYYGKFVTKEMVLKETNDKGTLELQLLLFAILIGLWPLTLALGFFVFVGYVVWKHFIPKE